MCIEVRYLAMCGHPSQNSSYDFCNTAIEAAKSRTKSLTMHLWRWSGKHLSQIDPYSERMQPCQHVKVKRKKHDPYWQKRLCECCNAAWTEQRTRRKEAVKVSKARTRKPLPALPRTREPEKPTRTKPKTSVIRMILFGSTRHASVAVQAMPAKLRSNRKDQRPPPKRAR